MSNPTVDEIATEQDPRWQAVIEHDSAFDGQFFYSVRTTGVYCRPSCASRLAKAQNVRFHPTCEAAQRAGFRACKRCKPDQPTLHQQHAARIAVICRIIESADSIPRLNELARQAEMSAHHFHRVFKAATGVTPKAYAAANRARRMRQELAHGASVTTAIYASGFHSSSRFYAHAPKVLGMTPTDFRAGGSNTQIHFAVGECSLGSILVAKSDKGICAILLGDDPDILVRDLHHRFSKAHLIGGDEEFEALIVQVVGFVEAPAIGLDLPLDVRGTSFQQRVWQALQAIPCGSKATYSEIALSIGTPKAVRAVASACASNALAVAIPCHRVVRHDGGLSGYRWGVERKRELLRRESAAQTGDTA